MNKAKVKTVLVFFIGENSFVHKEVESLGQTVNAAYYIDVLEKLRLVVHHMLSGCFIMTVFPTTLPVRQ